MVPPPSDRLCRFYSTPGGCARGTACLFEHSQGPRQQSSMTCSFFNSSQGCLRGTSCPFLHQVPSAGPSRECTGVSGDDSSRHRLQTQSQPPCEFFKNGQCTKGNQCQLKHVISDVSGKPEGGTQSQVLGPDAPTTKTQNQPEEEVDLTCSICYETPATYGILTECDHIFCFDCINSWRTAEETMDDDPLWRQESKGHTQLCPMCRSFSPFVISAPVFPTHDKKQRLIREYQDKVDMCRHFEISKQNHAECFCPSGDDCRYSHRIQGRCFKFGMTAAQMRDERTRQELLPLRRLQGLRTIGLAASGSLAPLQTSDMELDESDYDAWADEENYDELLASAGAWLDEESSEGIIEDEDLAYGAHGLHRDPFAGVLDDQIDDSPDFVESDVWYNDIRPIPISSAARV